MKDSGASPAVRDSFAKRGGRLNRLLVTLWRHRRLSKQAGRFLSDAETVALVENLVRSAGRPVREGEIVAVLEWVDRARLAVALADGAIRGEFRITPGDGEPEFSLPENRGSQARRDRRADNGGRNAIPEAVVAAMREILGEDPDEPSHAVADRIRLVTGHTVSRASVDRYRRLWGISRNRGKEPR